MQGSILRHHRIVPILAGWIACGLLLLSGCSGPDQAGRARTDGSPLGIVTTTGMIADLARQVGGDDVRVVSLMGPGVDPHLYKASEGDVRRLQDADLILYHGLHLEGAMAEVLERLSARRPAVAVAAGIPDSLLLSPPEFSGNPDPHIWFDVPLWSQAATVVAKALISHDPERGEQYRARLAAYREILARLHGEVRDHADRIPESLRVLVTAHDAFHYFGRAYGFQVRGLQGISTATEAGTADIQALADFIAHRRIPAIFVESSVSPRSIAAVQAAVRARNFDVAIGGELFSDALGEEGSGAETYVGMVRYNVVTIVSALLGEER